MKARSLALLFAVHSGCNLHVENLPCSSAEDCAATEVCSPSGRCVAPDTAGACGDSPCAAPIVETLPANELRETSLVARFSIAAPGNPAAVEAGICWAYDARPDTGTGSADCLQVAPTTAATGQVRLGDLEPGRDVILIAYAANSVARSVGGVVVASTLPRAPTDVDASDGTSTSHVTVDWTPSAGSVLYRVFRDDREVASIVTPPFVDTGATAATAPPRIADFAVSRDLPDRIELRWSPPSTTQGTVHRYHVIAEGLSGPSTASVADTGYRGASPILGYEVSRQGAAWEPVGDVENWVDTARYPFALTHYEARVSQSPGTQLAVECSGDVQSAAVTYRVRAITNAGPGDPSPSIGGQRGSSALTHTIEKLRDGVSLLSYGAGDFAVVSRSATTATSVPTPPREVAYFRCVLDDLGEPIATSELAWGYPRECDADRPCAPDDECMTGLCAPAGTARVLGARAVVGSPETTVVRGSDEVLHQVALTRDVLFATHEVTRGQWAELLGGAPTRFAACGDRCPVVEVTWDSAVAYANAVSEADGLQACYAQPGECAGSAAAGSLRCSLPPFVLTETGSVYDCLGWRLPTEAEWEHAGRGPLGQDWEGGTFSENESLYDCIGDAQSILQDHARYCDNAAVTWDGCSPTQVSRRTCAGPADVGSYAPTTWGLHDMYGNVAEFVWDAWRPYDVLDAADPEATPSDVGDVVVTRGGSWYGGLRDLRASNRGSTDRFDQSSRVGLRLVRTAFD